MTHPNSTHGHTAGGKSSPTYRSWTCMRERCDDPNHPSFGWYGGQGISYLPAWANFSSFLADMGERPEGMTLDRIDNSQDYGPGNCRWATMREQARNRRSVPLYALGGFALCITEWCMVFRRSRETAFNRIEKGWDVLDAVSQPPQPPGRKPESGVRAAKPAASVDCRGNRRPRPRMTAAEFRAHQAARLATRIAERKGIEVTW